MACGIAQGKYQMITVTGSLATNKLIVYLNGTECNRDETAKIDANFNQQPTIGARYTGATDEYYKGLIDEFGFWGRVLNQTEINTLYNNHRGYNPYTGGGAPPSGTNFTIFAKNSETAATITTFNVTMRNATDQFNYTTAAGSIITPFLMNESQIWNITITATNYLPRTYVDYNASTNLTGILTPYFQIRVFNNDTSAMLDNYTVTYLGINYTPDVNNITHLPIRGSLINFTINKYNFIQLTYNNYNSTNHLNASMFPYFQIRVFDQYTGNILNGTTILYNAVNYYPDANNITHLPVRNSLINFTVSKPTYFNRNFLNINATLPAYNATIYQAILNFLVRNVATGNIVTNYFIEVGTLNYTSTDGTARFNVSGGTYNYTVISTGYANKTGSVTVGNLSTLNTVVYLSPFINFTIYDEMTGQLFNFTGRTINNVRLSVHCDNQTDYYDLGNNNTNLYAAVNCAWNFLKLDFIYNDTTNNYYRSLVPTASSNNVNWYMIDVDNQLGLQIFFTLNDLTGDYVGGRLILTKFISGATRNIIQQPFNVENKVTAYLIKNQLYTLSVRSADGTEERNIGYFIADSAGERIITLPSIDFVPQDAILGNTVQWEWNGTNFLLQLRYNDTNLLTNNITYTVYNGTNLSHVLYTTTSYALGFVQFSYIAGNDSLLSCFDAYHDTFGLIHECKIYDGWYTMSDWRGWDTTSLTAQYSKIKLTNWFALILIILVFLGLRNHVTAGLAINSFLIWAFTKWQWLSLGSEARNYTILALFVLFTALSYYSQGDRKQ